MIKENESQIDGLMNNAGMYVFYSDFMYLVLKIKHFKE